MIQIAERDLAKNAGLRSGFRGSMPGIEVDNNSGFIKSCNRRFNTRFGREGSSVDKMGSTAVGAPSPHDPSQQRGDPASFASRQGAMKARHLLIADDNTEFRNYVRDVAGMMQYTVQCAGNGSEFIAAYEDFDPSHIIVDLVMPGIDGVELLEWLAGRGCAAKIFIVTGYSPDMAKVVERLAMASGLSIDGVYPKPIALNDLRALLA